MMADFAEKIKACVFHIVMSHDMLNILRFFSDTATHDVTYQSLMRLLASGGEAGSLLELPPIPDRFIFGHSAEELKKETKQIQFKQLSTPQYRYCDVLDQNQ